MKYLLFPLIIFTLILIISCREEIFFPEETTGSIVLKSTPSGAEIYLDFNKTGKVTPDSITGLQPGYYPLALKLSGYRDTSFSVDLKAGQKPIIHIRLAE